LTSWRRSNQQASILQKTEQIDSAMRISQRAIHRLVGRKDFLTLDEVAQLHQWQATQMPEYPTTADFALADKWLYIWQEFIKKHQLTKPDKTQISYHVIGAMWRTCLSMQPRSLRLLFKLFKLDPEQVWHYFWQIWLSFWIDVRIKLGKVKRTLGINYKFFK
ncbi:hypothetical protein ACFLYO_05495, partial [Chloroflexota bacterium]